MIEAADILIGTIVLGSFFLIFHVVYMNAMEARIRRIQAERNELRLIKDIYCIDCGTKTNPGKGSARCKDCWDARFGDL